MTREELTKRFIMLYETMQSERTVPATTWQEIVEQIEPRRGYGFPGIDTQSGKPPRTIYDSTATRANALFAASMHSLMTNPSSTWAYLQVEDDREMKKWAVKQYCQELTRIFMSVTTHSMFHSQVHEGYSDIGLLGNMIMFIDKGRRFPVRFLTCPLGVMSVACDDEGFPDIFCRAIVMTARNAADKFGINNLHENTRKRLEDPRHESYKVKIMHMVKPTKSNFYARLPGFEKPYESIYIDLDNKHILETGGYFEQPYLMWRFWNNSGEVYGTGPGAKALPTARVLNAMEKSSLRQTQKAADAPYMYPDKMFANGMDLRPGAPNAYQLTRGGVQMKISDLVSPVPQGSNFSVTYQEKADKRVEIEKTYFVDQLRLREGDRMTAEEVITRTTEKNQILGPILGRGNVEFFDPCVRRTMSILERSRMLPPPPPGMKGSLNVKFMSPAIWAMRYAEVQGLQKALGVMAPLMEVDPSMMRAIRSADLMAYVFEVFNAPMHVLEDPIEFQKMLAEEREQAQQGAMAEQQAQSMQSLSGSVKNIAEAQAIAPGVSEQLFNMQ